MNFTDLKEYVSFSEDALELLKVGIGSLPKGKQRDDAEKAANAAGETLARSDAKLAKELGFRLCQCTFPREPMLWKKDQRKHVCPKSGDTFSFEHPALDNEEEWISVRR